MNRALMVLSIALLVSTAAAAQDVEIVSPDSNAAVFGEVEVEVRVHPVRDVREVELLLDGRRVGVLEAPPFRFRVDVGQQNVEHRFEVLAHTLSGATRRAEVRTPKIHVDEAIDLELQQVYVTVTRRDGSRALDLAKSDFRVFDDNRAQEIVTFERGDVPFTALLLIDGSQSMRGERARAARDSAMAFVGGMEEYDEAKLTVFSDVLLGASRFVTAQTRGDLRPVWARLGQGGGSAVHDNLYVALRELETRQGRRVAVLLSDGEDVHSVLRMSQVLAAARRSQAQIYWVQLWGRFAEEVEYLDSWRDPKTARQELAALEKTVRQSGGRVLPIEDDAAIEPAFREILSELRDQYALGYYPDPERHDGSWRKLRVKLSAGGLRPRTREGYLDF